MPRPTSRRRSSAALTELVDRVADVAADAGNRAAEAILTTVDLAAAAISPASGPLTQESPPIRRRGTTGGATRRVLEAAAKTNRKLAHTGAAAAKKSATDSASVGNAKPVSRKKKTDRSTKRKSRSR
jgi:hypothetical protein